MTKKTSTSTSVQFKKRSKRKRPGVHAKTKNSILKKSRLWKKSHRGQGKKR